MNSIKPMSQPSRLFCRCWRVTNETLGRVASLYNREARRIGGHDGYRNRPYVNVKKVTCQAIASGLLAGTLYLTIFVSAAYATEDGVSFQNVKDTMSPMTDAVVGPFYWFVVAWNYMMANPPAAILLSAASAAIFTIVTLRQQASVQRLKHTFSMINKDNWDRDVIDARKRFGLIKERLGEQGGRITVYCYEYQAGEKDKDTAREEFMKDKVILETIMNDDENLALGVKQKIVDETYLFRWMRSALLEDWKTLSPLVFEQRQHFGRPQLYIEFEGLSMAWSRERSYAGNGGRRLNRPKRHLQVR